ncbi:MAG: MurR/RpiR family transcriptional regulator [Erysipelotrichaceae bacterium]|nr:MurR/RpiR family transcriptional regulator [Erysipelotrichaceae bacterium]
MEKTIMDTICSSYDSFFDSEKKIAKYIMNHYDQVVDMTVSQLATASGSSDASVSRFCKKIGVKGFHHLKISLAKEMVELDTPEVKVTNDISINNIHQSLQNILANKIEEMKQTVSFMNEDELKNILNIILKARMVEFVAVGNTIPVAMDGTFKFNQIGIPTVTFSIWETQMGMTYNMQKDDVVIAISNSGESNGVIMAVEAAKEVGAITIGITNSEQSSVGQIVDYHITTATREKIFLDGYCFSRVSATTIVEILYLFLTSMQENAYKSIARHENAIAGDKV